MLCREGGLLFWLYLILIRKLLLIFVVKYFQKIIYVMLYLIVLSDYAYTKSNMNKKIERIAVFEFENNRLDKEIAKTLTDRLRNELVQFDEIEIVERKRIDAVFQ